MKNLELNSLVIELNNSDLMSIDGGTEEGAYEMGKAIGEGIAAGFMVIGVIALFVL